MLLQVKDISFRYPGEDTLLHKISFSVDRGEVVAIIGPNGVGKTTLLMISAGLIKPDEGTVLIDGIDAYKDPNSIKRKIGFVFQNPDDQIFNPTVYDEIAYAVRQLVTDEDKVYKIVYDIAKRFYLDKILEKPPYKLSIGEKRLLTIASILVYEPDLIILDEPTANLSSRSIYMVREIINRLKLSGKGVLIASHNIEFIATVADRVYILHNKSIYGGEDAKTILTNRNLIKLADTDPPLIYRVSNMLGLKDKIITIDELRRYIEGKS